jgi:hypothetical protein
MFGIRSRGLVFPLSQRKMGRMGVFLLDDGPRKRNIGAEQDV